LQPQSNVTQGQNLAKFGGSHRQKQVPIVRKNNHSADRSEHFVSTQHRVKHIEATCSLSEIGAKSAKNLATSFYSQKAEEKKLSAALCAH